MNIEDKVLLERISVRAFNHAREHDVDATAAVETVAKETDQEVPLDVRGVAEDVVDRGLRRIEEGSA